MDDFSSSTVSFLSGRISFAKCLHLDSLLCCPCALVARITGLQQNVSSSTSFLPPQPWSQPTSAALPRIIGLIFVLSAAALLSNNRLLPYVYTRYWEQRSGYTAISSSEVTGRLGGYDYKQLAPPAILSSSSAVTSEIQIPRWPFDITFNFYLREKWNPLTLSHAHTLLLVGSLSSRLSGDIHTSLTDSAGEGVRLLG